MRKECKLLKSKVMNYDINECLDTFERLGQSFGMDNVLSHNDLLSGNILCVHGQIATPHMIFIDYEYCGYNYRAYDIANHFNEYCGFDFNIVGRFPNFQTRQEFLLNYIKSSFIHMDTSTSLSAAVQLGLVIDDKNSEQMIAFLKGFHVSMKLILGVC